VPPDKPAEPVAVGATTAEVRALEAELHSAQEQIAQLKADLAARTVDHSPPPAPARKAPQPPAPEIHDGPPPAPGPVSCETLNADDILAQATNQYTAGFPKAALLLVKKSLECQQSTRAYRIGAMSACAAHDAAAAREMLA